MHTKTEDCSKTEEDTTSGKDTACRSMLKHRLPPKHERPVVENSPQKELKVQCRCGKSHKTRSTRLEQSLLMNSWLKGATMHTQHQTQEL
ncbi:hypothetical protein BaRGS_00037169 [Batillaria attramentaria]|uniref:Uncharacterized protein n=1 Tax=Batillaria attramentaria TaxID=370345 RepID=A0ABD0JA73_9CAEN